MRSWWLSVAVILGGCFGLASAEYIIIVADVGPIRAVDDKGRPIGQPPGPIVGNPMGLPGGLNTAPPDLKEIEGKIVIAVLPLENTLTSGQQAQLMQKYYLQVPYQAKGHAHLMLLDYVSKHLDKARVGIQVYRASNPRAPAFGLAQDTPARSFVRMRDDVIKTGKATPEQLRRPAEYALGHGLNKDFGLVMSDWEKVEKDSPLVVGYKKLQESLKVQLPEDPLAAQRTGLTKSRQSAHSLHFTLSWNPIDRFTADAQNRYLSRLEDTLQTYYLWWLMKGVALPLPKARLTVFLDGTVDEFKNLHGTLTYRRDLSDKERAALKGEDHVLSAFTTAPLVSGGYFARRENVAVLSLRRIDPSYDLLYGYCVNTGIWDKQSPEKLLASARLEAGETQISHFEAQSFALMIKLMEEDAERASISHNVSQQLVVASGLLPQGVAAPEWVQFGLGSFFETPLNAPWASPTDPNSLYLPAFRKLVEHKATELEKPGETLKMVIRDGYFRLPADKADYPAALKKARALSWSLMYFLLREDATRTQLRAYFAELARLPRDMEITDEVLQRCFCRAFGIWDEAKQRVNDAAAQQLERHWFRVVTDTRPDFAEILTAVDKARTTMAKAAAEPMPPGQPGVPR